MNDLIRRILPFGRSQKYDDIQPDEIFLDSSNLPEFDVHQFEGRLIQPISKMTIVLLGTVFFGVLLVFLWRAGTLQIVHGSGYATVSENNRLAHTFLFPERGVVFDTNGELLAWNVPNTVGTSSDYSRRAYTATSGIAHVLGYVKYPQADSSGNYYKTEYSGETGVELSYDSVLNGVNGLKIVERDALFNVKSESVIDPPKDGKDITLTIDSSVQSKLYEFIESLAVEKGFEGGTGIIMDVHNGEILALTSFPEYDPTVVSEGDDDDLIASYATSGAKPYFNRAVAGRYTPGSIVKPFVAIGALNERVVTEHTKILSTGELEVPNPWNPELSSVFTDWKAHGWVNIKEALAISSNIYFYQVGGGYSPENQSGIGIENIQKYTEMFGLGKPTGLDVPGEVDGVIPNPEWKKEQFDGEPWRLGDTYNTAIGQYGFQVTPIQMVRGIAGIATNGRLVTPHVREGVDSGPKIVGDIDSYIYSVVQEGMRMAVTDGTAKGLNVPYVDVAAKTGTAEVGVTKARVNSWITGYFPYDEPRYAFVVMMEEGPRKNTIGGLFVMRQLLDWMAVHAPQYIQSP